MFNKIWVSVNYDNGKNSFEPSFNTELFICLYFFFSCCLHFFFYHFISTATVQSLLLLDLFANFHLGEFEGVIISFPSIPLNTISVGLVFSVEIQAVEI